MPNMVMANQIKYRLGTLNVDENAIVVLKGIPMSIVDPTVGKIKLSDVVSNKLGYFMAIFGKRKFLSYEEFLLMADFVVSQYKEIYVLNNNIYMEQYPVEECFDSDVRDGLLTHFTESEEGETDDRFIGDIDEYIAIFEGLKEYNGYLLGAYNTITALQSPKIINVNLFETKKEDLVYSGSDGVSFIEIIEEVRLYRFNETFICRAGRNFCSYFKLYR